MHNNFKQATRVPYILAMGLIASLAPAQTQNGEWTIGSSENPGKVRFSIQSGGDGHFDRSSSDWSASDFQGLDLATPGKHDVHFRIARDAGTLEGEGFARDSEAAGLYEFHANPQYIHDMDSLGFPGIMPEKLISFALYDVSLKYAREMKALGIQGLNADKLLACRIFHIDSAFINDLRSVGLNVLDVDKLIAFRIHGVTPDYVKELDRLGFAHPDPDKLIALRIHRVTPEFIEKLRAHGMQNLTLDQLVSLRIHGIE